MTNTKSLALTVAMVTLLISSNAFALTGGTCRVEGQGFIDYLGSTHMTQRSCELKDRNGLSRVEAIFATYFPEQDLVNAHSTFTPYSN
jgi:hypothetical protein